MCLQNVLVLAFLNVLVLSGHSRMVGYSILTLHFVESFILVLNSGCIMLIWYTCMVILLWFFCFVISVIYWRIWLLFMCFSLRGLVSVQAGILVQILFISAWLRNPVLSITCLMSFELYSIGILFLFCLLFSLVVLPVAELWLIEVQVCVPWMHFFLWITSLLQLWTFNKLKVTIKFVNWCMQAEGFVSDFLWLKKRNKRLYCHVYVCVCEWMCVCVCLQSV